MNKDCCGLNRLHSACLSCSSLFLLYRKLRSLYNMHTARKWKMAADTGALRRENVQSTFFFTF